MDSEIHTHGENIRKIEDIIDIQKANGNFNVRQVAFNLPETESNVSSNFSKSLDSGLSKTNSENERKKALKKVRQNHQKGLITDNISWPSDSDITVLRMKMCVTNSDLKDRVGNLIRGDGLHQRDSSSMVNLATLMRQSQPPSKHSFNIEEYLLPLTSWECEHNRSSENKELKLDVEETQPVDYILKEGDNYAVYKAVCSHPNQKLSSQDSNSDLSRLSTVSKLAKFLRLYFCPCCTCLYRLERNPSVYFMKRTFNVIKEAELHA